MRFDERTRLKDISPFKEMVHDMLSRENHLLTVYDQYLITDMFFNTDHTQVLMHRRAVDFSGDYLWGVCISNTYCSGWNRPAAVDDFRKYYKSVGELELFHEFMATVKSDWD